MNINKLKLVCFSPTGTTRKIVHSVARSYNLKNFELIDITTPSARDKKLQTFINELLIVAVPVYMGRVPSVIKDWLSKISAQNTPAVCIVVYGNRAYDNALLELKDIIELCGCNVIAGAAFIGEHSFSSIELPCSVGRPDTSDINKAEIFGSEIKKMIQSLVPESAADVNIPGKYPYEGTTDLWHIDFIEVNSNCTQCAVCADICPVGAIDFRNSSLIDKDKCTLCCACIENCPQHTRRMKPGLMQDAAVRCHVNFKERKEPEYFFSNYKN
jgi:ferredoxin